MNCYPSCCFFFSHLSTVTFFPVTFFPTWNCYFLSCFFFSHLSTVTFFPVTFFPVTFFPTWNCYFLSCYLFSCYFLSVHRLLQVLRQSVGLCHHQGWGQIRFIKYKYKYKYIFFRSFKYKYKYKYTGKNLIKYKYKYKYSSSNTNTNTNTQWGRDKIAAQGFTLSFLAGCPKSHLLGWYRNFLVFWYLTLDNQVVNSTCPKDKLGWIWRADDP